MKPTAIPDNEIWDGADRVTVTGFDDVADVQALVDTAKDGVLAGLPRYAIRCALENDDLEVLAAGGTVWLSFFGNVVPFALDVIPAPGQITREQAADLLLTAARGLPRIRPRLLAGDVLAIEEIHRAAIRNLTGPDAGVTLADLGRAADRLQRRAGR